LVKLDLATN